MLSIDLSGASMRKDHSMACFLIHPYPTIKLTIEEQYLLT